MFWRTILAAAAVTSFAGTAFAIDGDLSLSVGGIVDGSGVGVFETQGRVNLPKGGGWNLEVEAGGLALFQGGASQPYTIDAMAHLWGMHTATAAWGAFGGALFVQGPQFWVVGAEAKHFFQSASLGAAAAVVACGNCGGFTAAALFLGYNHYFNPNHRIGVRGTVLTGSGETLWQLSADAEHRFMHPVGLFGEVAYLGSNYGGHAWIAKGGFRFYLDGPADTLQSHEMKLPWSLSRDLGVAFLED